MQRLSGLEVHVILRLGWKQSHGGSSCSLEAELLDLFSLELLSDELLADLVVPLVHVLVLPVQDYDDDKQQGDDGQTQLPQTFKRAAWGLRLKLRVQSLPQLKSSLQLAHLLQQE